ncbi:MAG TPA: methyltransferase [Desulfobulbaceae bacterium]|nr:methyltransferase [Desulfobulbaceae bacterium]
MNIETLPERERQIYKRIRAKYRLTFDRLKIGEKDLRLLKIADLAEILGGKDPFANVSEFPFWVRLWDAAMVLAYVLGGQKDVAGKRLLELGAGLGAPGLAAAAAGYEVTISDYEDIIMDFQRVSAAASGLEGIEFIHLDWLNPPDLQPFDVLIGAEILFREAFFVPLLNIFKQYLKKDGMIFLAHDATRQSLSKFLQLAQDDFEISLKKQTLTRDGMERTIIVNRLRHKN